MGRIGDIGDEVEDMSDEAQDIIDALTDTATSQEDALDDLQNNLYMLTQDEIHRLYTDKEISPEAARTFEEHVDAELKGAGLRPYFENLRDDERPSEMYKKDYTRPSIFSTEPLEGFGGWLNGDPKR